MKQGPILIAAMTLGAFAVVGVGLVAVTETLTAEQIAHNEREALLSKLRAIVPDQPIENDPLADVLEVSEPELLGGATTTVYRVRSDGEYAAVILDSMVPNGYAGPIKLLVAVLDDHSLGGVRVVSHHETPGLGDKIEEQKSDWIYSFAGKSLGDPPPEKWGVKRDGGVFDQFTGATITPRSIVRAVRDTLRFVEQRDATLFAESAGEGAPLVEPPQQGPAEPGSKAGKQAARPAANPASQPAERLAATP